VSNDNVFKLNNPGVANEVRDAKIPQVGLLSPLDRSAPSFEVFLLLCVAEDSVSPVCFAFNAQSRKEPWRIG